MSSNKATVVLAHGAWADGSSWSKVIAGLHAAGIKSLAAPLPLTSYADDVAALERTLERAAGGSADPIVLVGHAYAGGVIAAARHPNVRSLVYIAAVAPAEGETVGAAAYRGEAHPLAPKLGPDAHGLIYLPPDAFASAFAQHASPAEQAILAAVQRPISPACISVPVGRPRWKDLPSWYLLAEEDRMITRSNQRLMAERMQARIRSHAVDHVPSVSAPRVVIDIIVEAVNAGA